MTTIIFVCADNLTRSVIAHYCCDKYLKKINNKNVKVLSAGTLMNHYDDFNTTHLEEMGMMNISTTDHNPTKLTQNIIDSVDLVVSMDKKVQAYIGSNFNQKSVLFSEIAFGNIQDVKIDWSKSSSQVNKQLKRLVHKIFAAMPQFIDNLFKFTN